MAKVVKEVATMVAMATMVGAAQKHKITLCFFDFSQVGVFLSFPECLPTFG